MRIHISNSDAPLEEHYYQQINPKDRKGLKMQLEVGQKWKERPVGLWYSFGQGWKEHVEKEYINQDDMCFNGTQYHVEIKDTCKLFKVTSIKELEELDVKYPEILWDDWRNLAQDYDGIEVTCLKEIEDEAEDNEVAQNHLNWIAKLEVSSGCIWNMQQAVVLPLPDIEM